MQTLPGINIQWPWSELLLSGKKTIETRTYPIPDKYRGQPLAIIETPGPRGKKEAGVNKARIVGVITFATDKQYTTSKAWREDFPKHCVDPNDPQYRFSSDKKKWGWIVSSVQRLKEPVPAPKKRGIVFASACKIP